MLYEIMCNEFVSKGTPRGRIRFNSGLNIVVGGEQSDNSIGKSTFLLAVDFCFGGNSYYTKTDLQTRFSDRNHSINFAFKFGETITYFARSIVNPEVVGVCDESYNIERTIKLDEFKDFLWEKYKLSLSEMTFRDVVGRYMRIYGKENYNEKYPLSGYAQESMEKGILILEKLFGYYDQLKPYQENKELSEKKKKALSEAIRQEIYTISIPNKTQFKNNEREIEKLQAEIYQMVLSTDKKMTDADLDNAEEILEQKAALSRLKRQRSVLTSRRKAIERNKNFTVIVPNDYTELQRFIPGINIAKLEEVQSFHNKIQHVMKDEIAAELADLEDMIAILDSQIDEKQEKIRDLGTGVELPQGFLKKYTSLLNQVEQLKRQNNARSRVEEIKQGAKKAKSDAQEVEGKILTIIENKINEQMVRFNDFIYDGMQSSPVISFRSQKQYDFSTPDDGGMGTGYKSLIIFDLSILKLTQLPVLVHDSLMFNHIGYQPLEKIMKLYCDSEKQIFIAYDKKNAPTAGIQKILDDSMVLHLSQGGNELFGYSWARKNASK